MKRVFIVIPLRKVRRVLVFFIVVSFSIIAFYTWNLQNSSPGIQAAQILSEKEGLDLVIENERLKGTIESLYPDKNQILYENQYNRYENSEDKSATGPDYKVYPLEKVIREGGQLGFKVVYNNPGYLRPVYDPLWRGFYFRSWLYIPEKVIQARHRLFIYYGGLSNIFDFEGSLGFSESVSVDYHRNINFLIYKFNVSSVRKYNNQITLVGEPSFTGVQVISVSLNEVLPKSEDSIEMLVQLSTPGGYEIDYEYGRYEKSEYLKELEKEDLARTVYSFNDGGMNMEQLLKENRHLKKELSYYIPLEEKIITEKSIRQVPKEDMQIGVENIIKEGKEVSFSINYKNGQYKRPVYHPSWKKNYREGWGYVPVKLGYNMHNVFVLPQGPDDREKLLGQLAFFESYKSIDKNQVGILVYGFSIDKIYSLDNRIVIIGKPSNAGAQIISLSRYNINLNEDSIIKLVTPDYYEMDYEILIKDRVSYLL